MNIALYLDKHRQTKHVPFCTLKSCTEKHTECSIGKLNVDMILIFAVGIISFTTPVKLPASRNQGLIKIIHHHSLWIQVPPKKILYPPNCTLSAFLATTWIHRDWSSWSLSKAFFFGLISGWPGRGEGKDSNSHDVLFAQDMYEEDKAGPLKQKMWHRFESRVGSIFHRDWVEPQHVTPSPYLGV